MRSATSLKELGLERRGPRVVLGEHKKARHVQPYAERKMAIYQYPWKDGENELSKDFPSFIPEIEETTNLCA